MIDQASHNRLHRSRMRRKAGASAPLSELTVLDFAHQFYFGRGFGPVSSLSTLAAVVRANEATSFDLAGNLKVAPANNARVSSAGVRIEAGGQTNYVRNNTFVGAVAGALGAGGALPTGWTNNMGASGLASSAITVGTPTKMNGVDVLPITIAGTPTGASNINIIFEDQAPALNAQVWTGAVYLAQVAGSVSATSLELDEMTSANGFLAASTGTNTPVIDATLRRYSLSRTNNNASTAKERFQARFATQAGIALNVTVYIGLPTLEQAAAASATPLRTTNAAVTSAADQITVRRIGIGKAVFTFDDGSKQTITGINQAAQYTIPTNLNRPIVKKAEFYAA